jgi:hypothetical protein
MDAHGLDLLNKRGKAAEEVWARQQDEQKIKHMKEKTAASTTPATTQQQTDAANTK